MYNETLEFFFHRCGRLDTVADENLSMLKNMFCIQIVFWMVLKGAELIICRKIWFSPVFWFIDDDMEMEDCSIILHITKWNGNMQTRFTCILYYKQAALLTIFHLCILFMFCLEIWYSGGVTELRRSRHSVVSIDINKPMTQFCRVWTNLSHLRVLEETACSHCWCTWFLHIKK